MLISLALHAGLMAMSSMWTTGVPATDAAREAASDGDELETFAIYVRVPAAGDSGSGESGAASDGGVLTPEHRARTNDAGALTNAGALDAAQATSAQPTASSAQPTNAPETAQPSEPHATTVPPASPTDAATAEATVLKTASAATAIASSAPGELRTLGASEAAGTVDAALVDDASAPTALVADSSSRAALVADASASAALIAGASTGSGATAGAAVGQAAAGVGAGVGASGEARSGAGDGNATGGDASGGAPGAVLVFGPRPEYPELSVRRGEEGQVLCSIHIDASGSVTRVDVIRSSGSARLDRAAQDALAKWRFLPARKDGRAVACRVPHAVTFRLE